MDSTQTTPKRAYDREFLLRLKPAGDTPSPVILDALKPFCLTKDSTLLTPKKTLSSPYKSPAKPSPSKVYVLKSPAKDDDSPLPCPVTPALLPPGVVHHTPKVRKEEPSSPSKLQSASKPTTPFAGSRVPLGVVKGPRTPLRSTPASTSINSLHKENYENITTPMMMPIPKLVLPPAEKPAIAPVEPANTVETSPSKVKGSPEKETDAHRLAQRQKQIEYGKKTVGYQRFISMVPRDKREAGAPITPRKNQKCSKRSWDGQVRKWRRELHKWDPVDEAEMERWKAIVREKFGDIEEEEFEGCEFKPILNQTQQIFVQEAPQTFAVVF